MGRLAGGLGFSLGQSVQAAHAWNAEWFRTTAYVNQLEPHINWWNMMETTFGAIFGAILAPGVWLNRQLIDLPEPDATNEPAVAELTPACEWLLIAVHVTAVLVWNFLSLPVYDPFADLSITMILIPVVAVVAGHWWPYLMTLPIVLIPIAGKTVRELVYASPEVTPLIGWTVYLTLPLVVALLTAWWLFRQRDVQTAGRFAAVALLVNTWIYFALNLAVFRYPWPWQDWTGRTPNGLIFFVCAVGLTIAVIVYGRTPRPATP